ncbi:MAG: hypothetical protein AAFX52_04215 [Pseudomonadota bacterium]
MIAALFIGLVVAAVLASVVSFYVGMSIGINAMEAEYERPGCSAHQR